MKRWWCDECRSDFMNADIVKADTGDYEPVMHEAVCPYCGSEDIHSLMICECCGDEYIPYRMPEGFRNEGKRNKSVDLCEDCMAKAEVIYREAEVLFGKKYNLEQLFSMLCEMKGW